MSTPRCQALSPDRRYQCKRNVEHSEADPQYADKRYHWPRVPLVNAVRVWQDSDAVESLDISVPAYPTIALSGARKMTLRHTEQVERELDGLVLACSPLTVVCGAALGLDGFAAAYLYKQYTESVVHVHTVVPANRSEVDSLWAKHCHSHELMPDNTTYRQRNNRMSDMSDFAHAWPLKARSEMGLFVGGTWQFINYTRAQQKIDGASIHVLDTVKTIR